MRTCRGCVNIPNFCIGEKDGGAEKDCYVGLTEATAQPSPRSVSDALICDVEVGSEETLSGWKQPYVSLRIGNFEFKRLYQTKNGAERCVAKVKELLTAST